MNYTDYPNYPHRGTNEGCGHIYPRPDGSRMRCGGWRGCTACASDALDAGAVWAVAAAAAGNINETAAAAELLAGAGRTLRQKLASATAVNISNLAAQEGRLSAGARGLFQTVPSTWDRHQ